MVEGSLKSSTQIKTQQFLDSSCLGIHGPWTDVCGMEDIFQEGQMLATVLQEPYSQSWVLSIKCIYLLLRRTAPTAQHLGSLSEEQRTCPLSLHLFAPTEFMKAYSTSAWCLGSLKRMSFGISFIDSVSFTCSSIHLCRSAVLWILTNACSQVTTTTVKT